jgi:lipooligosaccharide transport system permease protein
MCSRSNEFLDRLCVPNFLIILATPVNMNDLVAGELIWGATKSVLYGTIIILVISLFGLVDSPLIILAIPFLFICGLIFSEISMIFAAIVPGIDSFNYFYTLLMTPMFLFSGIFFPLDTLPPAILKIAFFTPLYHLVNICRSFSSGLLSGTLWDIIWIFAVFILLSPYPFRLMRKRMIQWKTWCFDPSLIYPEDSVHPICFSSQRVCISLVVCRNLWPINFP